MYMSQYMYCKICNCSSHRTSDIKNCRAHNAIQNITAFKNNDNPLSNFYVSPISLININYGGKIFKNTLGKILELVRAELDVDS